MDFKINTDTWFIFCILFIGILALFILFYIAIPYRTRIRNTKRRQKRLVRKLDNFERLEKKYSDLAELNCHLETFMEEDNYKKRVFEEENKKMKREICRLL